MIDRAHTSRAAGLAIAALVLALLPAHGLAADTRPEVVAGQWIVLFEDGVEPDATAADLAREHGLGLIHVYEHALRGFAAVIPDAKLAALRADARIGGLAPDRAIFAFDGPTGVDRIDAEGVSGMGGCAAPEFRVAILDTGVDFDHPDLNVDAANSQTFVPGGPDADDQNGHGTHVAGSVAAKIGVATVNGVDVRGVAPGACLVAIKVLGNNGSGSDSSVIAGLDYVAANAAGLNVRVANLSLGRPAGDDALLHTAIRNTAKAGVVVVVAAGNVADDAANHVPAAYDEVITVSAVKDSDGAGGALGGVGDDTFASFSNFGVDVDVAAPGVDILSTFKGGGYATGSGTSFSAPLVAGALAERIAAGALNITPSTDPMATRNAAMAVLGTKPQDDPECGFTGDPDSHDEPLVYVGEPNAACAVSGSGNQAPTVSAGADHAITLPDAANLSGSASDDGLPDPPGAVTTTWSKVSGPGTVVFGDASALSTTATFSSDGVYVLRLTADDSVLQNTDDVIITVSPANPVVDVSLRFVPVEPCAVFDTRFGSGGLLGRHGGGDLLTFTVASDGALPSDQGGEACSPPPGDADAVMLNLVAVSPTGGGNLRVSEHGVVAAGGVVNFSPAEGTNSSAVPVEVDASGRIDVFINSGNESVTFVRGVVLGYYVDPDVDPSGLLFVPIDPCAVFDTRGGDAMDGGETRTFHVAGTFNPTTQGGAACTPPPSGAEAAMVNLVAIDPTKGGNLQAVASGGTPNGGVVNFAGLGSDNSNAVPIGLDGFGDMDVTVNNSGTDTVDVRGVVLGYYIPDTHPNAASGLGLVPMNSCAVFDTRSGTGIYQGRIDGGTTLPFTVASDSALPGAQGPGGCESPPSYAEAVMLNLVAIGPQDGGNLRASAQGTPANGGVVNFSPSRGTNSNAVPVAVDSNGKIDVYVNSGSNSVVDIRGVALAYYVAPN